MAINTYINRALKIGSNDTLLKNELQVIINFVKNAGYKESIIYRIFEKLYGRKYGHRNF